MRVMVQVVNAIGVKRARPADDTVHFIPFGEQKLGQIRAVLPGDAREQRFFHLGTSLTCNCTRAHNRASSSSNRCKTSCLLQCATAKAPAARPNCTRPSEDLARRRMASAKAAPSSGGTTRPHPATTRA